MSEQYTCGYKKKGMKWATTYSSLLFYFGFGYTNGVTTRSFLSRLPGVRFPQHLGSLAPGFLSGLQRCQCALTPISPLRWHLSLLRHTICSLSSLWAKWKEVSPLDMLLLSACKSTNGLWVPWNYISYLVYGDTEVHFFFAGKGT